MRKLTEQDFTEAHNAAEKAYPVSCHGECSAYMEGYSAALAALPSPAVVEQMADFLRQISTLKRQYANEFWSDISEKQADLAKQALSAYESERSGQTLTVDNSGQPGG